MTTAVSRRRNTPAQIAKVEATAGPCANCDALTLGAWCATCMNLPATQLCACSRSVSGPDCKWLEREQIRRQGNRR